MVFQVPAAEKPTKAQENFEFEIGGQTFSVRRLKFLPIGRLEEIEVATLEFFAGSTKKQADAVRSLNSDQFIALVTGWRQDSQVTVGESQASGA